ncbi:hypothetical protein ACWD5Q_06735 [Streptomyces sp. NPDC002513]
MSAPTSRDPLVVRTQDGTCWVRRAVTKDKRGLYVVNGAPRCCPEYVMATLRELAELGLASMADALPMPVGPELKTWQARVDEVERKYAFDTAELKRQLESARVDRQRLIRAEQRRAELEAVLGTHREDDQAEIKRLRERVAALEAGLPAMQEALTRALDRIAELEAERHTTNEALADVTVAQRAAEAAVGGITRRFAPTQALREDEPTAVCRCDEPGADPYSCEADDCSGHFSELNPFGGARPVNVPSAEVSRTCGCGWRTSVWHVDDGSADEELHGHIVRVHGGITPTQAVRVAEDVTPQVQKLRSLLAGQRTALEDPHDSPLHREYRVSRDLPEMGGAR